MASGDQYGPALPPGMVVANECRTTVDVPSKKRKILGPKLPPGMQKSSDSDDLSDEGQLTVKMESELSPEYSIHNEDDDDDEEDDDDDEDKSQGGRSIGPMPSEMNQAGESTVHAAEEFERRSKRMKEKLTVKAEAEEGPSKREEWMTELPPEMGKNFGLQSRTFTKGGAHSDDSKDRSSWTETPSVKKEKDSKGKKRRRDEDKTVSVRDEQMRQQVEDYNKSKRPESLMDIHTKKMKKKKKKEKKEKKKRKEKGEKEEKEARRPFDREKDLQTNVFDDAQRKSIIKKSQLLNTRFSHGGTTSHFL